jgi:hypothetical protein
LHHPGQRPRERAGGNPLVGSLVLLQPDRFSSCAPDAAYFDRKTLGIICTLFRAKLYVDYNLRRKGKKFLATLPLITLIPKMSPLDFLSYGGGKSNWQRGELLNACLPSKKRLLGLNYFQVQGLVSVTRYSMLSCMAMLLTAPAAQAIHQPELMPSPKRLLAL